MPKYVPSEKLKQAITEPVEFDYGGASYSIARIPLEIASAVELWFKDTSKGCEAVMRALIGDREWEKRQKLGIDARETMRLVGWIVQEVLNAPMSGEEKNAPGPLPESPEASPDSSDTPTC